MLCPSRIRGVFSFMRKPRFVDYLGQIGQQPVTGQGTPLAHRFAMSELVVGLDRKPPAVEAFGDMVVTPGMFAQAMHDQHHSAHRPLAQGPVDHHQVGAILGRERAEVRAAHPATRALCAGARLQASWDAGNHPGHCCREFLGIRHMQELIGAMRIAARPQHATDHHLGLWKSTLEHVHQRDGAPLPI